MRIRPQRLAISRLAPDDPVPEWALGTFVSVTRTNDELSIICDETAVPDDVQSERGWRTLEVVGPLDFTEVGILVALAGPLAEANISVFVISTYDTDFLLVRETELSLAIEVLEANNHTTV